MSSLFFTLSPGGAETAPRANMCWGAGECVEWGTHWKLGGKKKFFLWGRNRIGNWIEENFSNGELRMKRIFL